MRFKESKPIYLQIAERIADEILQGVYAEDERIPSVREYAVKVEVNVNTMVRSFENLQNNEIIYNKRGIGYFVAPGAVKAIQKMRKQQFKEEEMPDFFRQASILEMTAEELATAYTLYLKKTKLENSTEHK